MLFFLTGDIQTGKTRWLSDLVGELEAAGVRVAGVLAPGVWRERGEEEMTARAAAKAAARETRAAAKAATRALRREGEGADAKTGGNAQKHPDPAGEGRFEKLGIDNLLLPQHERIAFARRGDLAKEQGAYRPGSQSARAGLAWEIDDGSVARVNAHFARLAENGAAGASGAGSSLLVVDELGRLELLRGEGLVEAMRLLGAGPASRFPHAVAVVRKGLLEEAHAALDGVWEAVAEIAPDERGREAVLNLFGCR